MAALRFVLKVFLLFIILNICKIVNSTTLVNQKWISDNSTNETVIDDKQVDSKSIINIKISDSGDVSVVYGLCSSKDDMIHTEDIIIDNEGPSTLSGVFEFHLDLAAKINCVEIQDKGDITSKSTPLLNSGGPGHNWLSVKVRGKYSKGIYVLVKVFGIPDSSALSN